MSRKRKSDQEPPVETISEKPPVETGTAVAEPPAAEPNGDGQTFADRVGQKKWISDPDPFPIATDNIAGVRLFQSKQDRQMAIMFGDGSPKDKPRQAVIDRMKDAGFRWNPSDRIWALSFTPDFARRTHIEAEKVYQQVCQMIRQEKGIESTQDIPF